MACYLSVVVPVYNEQKNIEATLKKISDYLFNKKISSEIIIVNDGSTDDTLTFIKKFKDSALNNLNGIDFHIIDNKANYGKGYSVKSGVLASKGEYVLFTDADLSTPIEELDIFMDIILKDYNIAIASRDLPDSNIVQRQHIIRESMGKFFNFLVRSIMNLKYKDTQCGFKLFDRKSANIIFPKIKINNFSFDVEILHIADKLHLKVIEVPVTWNNSKDSKVKILKDSIQMLISLIKIKSLHKKT